MDDELRRAWKELKEGRIAYQPKISMRQGRPEEVVVRISDDPSTDVTEGLTGEIWIERIQTSGSMAAYLEGKKEEFDIVPLTSTRQALVGSYSDWRWEVTPLKPGERDLNLRVIATIRLSQGLAEDKDVVVSRRKIEIEVDRVWASKRFIVLNWQWLLGSPVVLGLATWIIARLRKESKRKKAGFE